MPYVTPQTLVDAFGERELVELTDRAEPRANVVDFAVAQRQCDRAIAEVNAAVAMVSAMPLATVPELLPYLALDLARFYLWETDPPDLVKTRFETAQKMLADIASGRRKLGPDASGENVVPTSENLPAFNGGASEWARGRW
jgi:phage gp36-like protein